MPQIITYGAELIRINTSKNKIEYSTNKGATWNSRYSGSSVGTFIDLIEYGIEIIACTAKGFYYSSNKGATWNSRYTSPSAGNFLSLQNNGKELLASTSKGLYYSTNKGATWNKRGS